MKLLMSIALMALLSLSAFAQAPSQIKQIIPGTPSVVFNWTYNTSDESFMDSFVLQRTQYSTTTTITSPYDVEVVISQKTIRSATHTLPAAIAGQSAFYVMRARKQGLADSGASNVVQIQVVPTPPVPGNLSIARLTEVEFTKKSLNGVALWFITRAL